MAEKLSLDFIDKNISILNQIYDVVRIVDPFEKSIINLAENQSITVTPKCFEIWDKGKACENCISARALNERRSFFKLEQKEASIMMVTVFPVYRGDRPLVIELAKNVTDSLIIGSNRSTGDDLIGNILMNLNDLVVKDQMTSLYNRRFIEDRLPVDIFQGRSSLLPLSLLFVDLDNLKTINDVHGHQAGDLAIKLVGTSIVDSIRSDNDWAARYGGDEFIVCLNNTEAEKAFLVAERIRTRIEQTTVLNGEIKITVSIGIHTVDERNQTAEEIISLADRKMYEAKKAGKNMTIRVAG